MIDPFVHIETDVLEPEHLRHSLAEAVSHVLERRNGHAATDRHIVQVALPVGDVKAFRWLQAQSTAAKVYWSGRDGTMEVAAMGEADVCCRPAPAGFEALRRHLAPVLASCDPQARYYGGLRFDPSLASSEPWAAFGAYRFVLPRFEVRMQPEGAVLICNLVLPRDHDRKANVLAEIKSLSFSAGLAAQGVPTPVGRADQPARMRWSEMIAWALGAFETNGLDKVVFAREAAFDFDGTLDPLALLENLKAGTPGCFHFCFQPAEGTAFVGASPERLFRRQGRIIDSEAVAGTRPRGASATDDARLLEELLQSDKDQREHEYVRISLREKLGPLSETFHLDAQPSEMKLASGRHLVSRAHSTLREEVTSLDVLQALHPTPAVGGYPTPEALSAIRSQEPFDRGWYAGPVGWIGPDAAEFAVGIRSGLVQPRHLSLFSGAGIVPGSRPNEEWKEIECKISDFIKVLGLRT
ncbi:MAG TPA: isochorismate synthase [Rhodothermales bacterium]|nr:isochorismate synthase [Rhodothermales bacterium]